MREMAAERGGRCISRTFVNGTTKMHWECAKGHRFWLVPMSIRHQGAWCPDCLREERFASDVDSPWNKALRQAELHKGACLSNVPTKHSLRWRCAEGHEWTNNYFNIARGKWCPSCSGRRLDISHMQATAAERGGRCVSKKYVNSFTKLHWECDKGHRWWATPGHVRGDESWCPECAWDRNAENKRSEAKDRR